MAKKTIVVPYDPKNVKDSNAYKSARDVAQNALSSTKDIAQNTKDVAQNALSSTKDIAQNTYDVVQDNVKTGFNKTQGLLAAGAGTAAVLLNKKKIKKAQKDLKKLQESIQGNMGTSWEKAQDTFGHSSKKAQKNLKKAQKNLKNVQGNLQDNLNIGMAKTQDIFEKSSKQAGKKFKKVTSNAKDLTESVQDQLEHYQHKRQRAKALFRIGLVAGIVLTLMYTPIAGSKVRARLAEQWNQYKSYVGL